MRPYAQGSKGVKIGSPGETITYDIDGNKGVSLAPEWAMRNISGILLEFHWNFMRILENLYAFLVFMV